MLKEWLSDWRIKNLHQQKKRKLARIARMELKDDARRAAVEAVEAQFEQALDDYIHRHV